MAQLPPDGDLIINMIGSDVVIFHRYSEEEYHRWNASDQNATAQAMGIINTDERLTAEQKCFAYFWAGYFYAHAA